MAEFKNKYIVVGWIYNNNGMATWFVEVAKSLNDLGYYPILILRSSVDIKLGFDCLTIHYDESKERCLIIKIRNRIRKYLIPFIQPTGFPTFIKNTIGQLHAKNIHPS